MPPYMYNTCMFFVGMPTGFLSDPVVIATYPKLTLFVGLKKDKYNNLPYLYKHYVSVS